MNSDLIMNSSFNPPALTLHPLTHTSNTMNSAAQRFNADLIEAPIIDQSDSCSQTVPQRSSLIPNTSHFNEQKISDYPNVKQQIFQQQMKLRDNLLKEKLSLQPDPRFLKDHIALKIKMLKEKNKFDLLEQTILGAEMERRSQLQRLAENTGTFNGMYHIFDHHKSTVTRIHFANNEKSLFACCAADGNLSICQLFPEPASVIYILKGHTSSVSDFQWSLSNDLIVSGSFDCTVRVWCTSSGKCLRVIKDPTDSPVAVCSFQPINNNMVIIGNHKGYLHVLNVSTGIAVKAGSVRVNTAARIQCITLDNDGKTVWVGDSKGFVSSYSFDLKTGSLTRLTKCIIAQDASVTSISVKNYVYNNEAKGKFLLVNSCSNSVLVFRIDSELKLRLKYTLSIKHQDRSILIKSKFCPLAITKENAGLASGSEDYFVYFYTGLDFFSSEESHLPKLTKLQGHSAPVLDVCFNCDESLLASSDTSGIVIIWKKDTTPL